MTKADIARAVYERHGGLSSREAARLVDLVFALVKDRLLAGEKVQITGFGTFLVKTRLARRGRNPKTGKIIPIRARRSVFFRSSPQVGPSPETPVPGAGTRDALATAEQRRTSAGRPAA